MTSKKELMLCPLLMSMSLINCGKTYVTSCKLLDYVNPEWEMPKASFLENTDHVFKQDKDDGNYVCLKRTNIIELFYELNMCTYARKGLLDLVHKADTVSRK